MKQKLILGVVLLVSSILLSYVDARVSFAHMLKCLTLAYAVTILSHTLLQPCIKVANPIVYYMGIIVLVVYTVIAMDSYLFHTLASLPGILRYALFSTYGWWYLFFILVGFCLCFKEKNRCNI